MCNINMEMTVPLMLGFPLKKAGTDEFSNPLLECLRAAHEELTPEILQGYLVELEKLEEIRNKYVKRFDKVADKRELVDRLSGYYDALVTLNKKIDPTASKISLKFDDAFDEGSYFRRTRATSGGLHFEIFCILFNIAAAQSQMLSSEGFPGDEELRVGTRTYQQLAGYLCTVQDNVALFCYDEPTPDIRIDTLNALSSLMLAQAQELVLMKAIKDGKKSGPIAKLAVECGRMNKTLSEVLSRDDFKWMFPRASVIVAAKAHGYMGVAEYFQTLVCHDLKKYGEGICRLTKAKEFLNAAAILCPLEFPRNLKSFQESVETLLVSAVKENDVIYCDVVPKYEKCEELSGFRVVKLLPFSGNFSSEETSFCRLPDFEPSEEKLLEQQASLTEEELSTRRSTALDLKTDGLLEKEVRLIRRRYSFKRLRNLHTGRFKRCLARQNIVLARSTFFHCEHFVASLQDLNRALHLNENYVKARLKRAQVFEKLGNISDALQDYKSVLMADPEQKECLDAIEKLEFSTVN
ncbi:unnamed protein product [Notodromas monacha]|uniref:BRO1 domain-containing protein n=1 Tax=Notodromas monacha TaxID=399045 RepID=A0A7R9BRH6_9CRUS|nr:unnamed protein product [Notodromas monacha]CAG0918964.1 unnamed protein product [Notodromas monacha]